MVVVSFTLQSFVFPLEHTVQIIYMKPLSEKEPKKNEKKEKKKKSHFCVKQKVSILHALL